MRLAAREQTFKIWPRLGQHEGAANEGLWLHLAFALAGLMLNFFIFHKIYLDLGHVAYVNAPPYVISLKQYYVLINGSEPGGRPFTPAGFLRLCRIRNLQKIQTRRGKERKTK